MPRSLERRQSTSSVASTIAEWSEIPIVLPDPEHSATEDRFVLIGLSIALRVLVVVHCEPEPDGALRLISARCHPL